MAERANLIEWSNSSAAEIAQQQQRIQQIVRDSHQRFAASLKKTQQDTIDLMKYSEDNKFYLGKYDLSNISAGLFKTDNRPAYTWSTNHTTPNDSWYHQVMRDELDDLFSDVFYEEPELVFGLSPMSAVNNMKDYIL